jgi:hypothetical protein
MLPASVKNRKIVVLCLMTAPCTQQSLKRASNQHVKKKGMSRKCTQQSLKRVTNQLACQRPSLFIFSTSDNHNNQSNDDPSNK